MTHYKLTAKHFFLPIIFCLLLGTHFSAFAQLPVYKMLTHRDTTVTECKGEFYDSDEGPGQNYLAQARDTFRICTGGTISMSFLSFQLENGLDTLSFYNGNTISAGTLIGKFTGSNTPTGIVATGCLTIVFKSSFVLQDQGWFARWTSTVVPPVPPNISISPTPNCNTTTVDIVLSKKIQCDSAYASAFQLTGPITPIVTGASAISCIGDSTTNVRLQLSIPLTQNCNYSVAFTINMPDNCDSIWTFTVNNSFTITNCAITVNINATPNDTICAGTCTQLQSVINSCLSYNYYWSHGLSNTTTHSVCPASTTTYTLGVQSTSGGPMYTSSITIVTINPQITPLATNPVCQSDAPFNLTAVPSGGIWTGQGITDTIQGTFDPDTAMQGTHVINYNLNGLCSSTYTINVTPMDAGLDEAACPGSPAFSLSGFTPAGGTWSGYAGLTAGGVFNPTTLGTYTVNYTHPNGCSDLKQVFVQPLVISNATDTICESAETYTMTVSPPGGRWVAAAGIIDTINGVIDPSAAGGGMHNYYYKLNGCMDTAHIYVKPIFAGWDFVRCPVQPTFTITQATPTGGIWTAGGTSNGGASALISPAGLYNPGIQPGVTDFTDTLIYTAPNGCTDSVLSYISTTNIIEDTLFFCSDDNRIRLEWGTTRNYPWGGVWTGPGVSKVGNDYYFNPVTAGVGIHTLTYNANTCADQIKMVVYPAKLSYNDTTICTIHPAFILDPIGLNATWQGQGIVNGATGLFDPAASGLGTFPITYSTPSGCRDTIYVTVYLFRAAAIGGLNTKYCYTNFNYPISLAPAGGTLTGTGIIGGNAFNPATAGAGQHTLIYSFGSGPCFTIDSITIDVSPAITTTVTVTNSPICRGDGATITIVSAGGDPTVTSHTQTWSHRLFSTNVHVVSPSNTTTYTITTSDGCSDNAVDTARIIVNPDFTINFTTSPIDCNGTDGTADITVTGPSTYSYVWSTSPVETTNAINGISGSSYFVTVTDIATGCFHDSTVTIPGYGIINSLFSVNPSLPCIPFTQGVVTFIDLSLGATHGYWQLSNDSIIPYTFGVNPQVPFTQSGDYTMLLHVENIGNCVSEMSIDLCIQAPVTIFVPDIFSPNGDGINDVCYVRGKGISKLSFIVYDRWGEKVFETSNPDIGWNGTFKSKDAETGVYVYYLNATMFDDSKIEQKGDISLVR